MRHSEAHEADTGPSPLLQSSLGSGLLAQQPTPAAEEAIAVAKVCPQCGAEYETGDRFCPKDGSPLRPKTGGDPLIGRVIADRYLVLARLGEGGMGRVYLAEHVKMNRQCAIKVMNPSLVNDAESSQRFAREASSAARILHSNVAAVFDYGESDKIVYLVMEYVDGEPLSSMLSAAPNGALEPRRAIDLARQIADGLQAAHELGIVHRDLKPDNVIVARSRSGREIPKIVDFGIAKAVSEAPQDALTRSGLVIGTPEYMSPEQLLGDPVDSRADIYSLGCILYQMLTGNSAFAAESREQMIRRRLHEAPPHVRDVLPDMPRRLDTLIVHMLARSPADRLASAAEARDALDPALMRGGWDPATISGPRPMAPTPRSAPTVLSGMADPSMQPTQPMPKQHERTLRVVGAGLLGAVLVGGGAFFWANRSLHLGSPATSAGMTVNAPAANAAPLADTSLARGVIPGSGASHASNRQANGGPAHQTPRVRKPDSLAAPKGARGAASTVAKTLQPRADSSAMHAPPKTDSALTEVSAVRRAFDPLIEAIRDENIAAVSRAVPKLLDNQRGFYKQLFENMEDLRAIPDTQPVSVQGSQANVPVTFKLQYVNRSSKQKNMTPVTYDAVFEKHGGVWQLIELRPKN